MSHEAENHVGVERKTGHSVPALLCSGNTSVCQLRHYRKHKEQ